MAETPLKPNIPEVAIGGDRRLIEDYLPIQSISEEARIENSVTHAHGYLSKALLSILHRWWARRPLVACRAAVYAALVSLDQFRPKNGPPEKRDSLARANATKWLESLCRRTVTARELEIAAAQIRQANGGQIAHVLDQFAGGGSIPLETARLGCVAHALELNPVAHLVELATLVYPSQYGAQLPVEVGRWSEVVLERARAEVGDLYARLPDPQPLTKSIARNRQSKLIRVDGDKREMEAGGVYLTPVAYLWTRTVPCKNCGAIVPLHRQTWLRRKAGAFVALRPVALSKEKRVGYQLLNSTARGSKEAIDAWGFDPTNLSTGGETECPFCRTTIPIEHVKDCGRSNRMNVQLMAIVATRTGKAGKTYIPFGMLPEMNIEETNVKPRLETVLLETKITPNDTALPPHGALGFRVQPYGFKTWDELFTFRQLLTLTTLVKHVRACYDEMIRGGLDSDFARAIMTYLAFIVDKVVERSSSVGIWDSTTEKIQRPVSEGKLPMTWDFAESNPFGGSSGSWEQARADIGSALSALVEARFPPCKVQRGSALSLPFENGFFDAVITDPPYYDNVPYSYLADFFYVWLKRTVGHLYPEHFAGAASPTKAEAVMDPSRHNGSTEKAKKAYESMMAQAFAEARRVLKPGAPMACVYAHKTTAGWATLVDALRTSGFVVTEAWPIDTENPSRQRSKESAALASSIFLVARRREVTRVGSYEDEVRPELERIVRERVESLWDMGMTGADLVIAAVGAGLRAFTRFSAVEHANGEEVPAERFLVEVEGMVLETLLEKFFGVPRSAVAAVDAPSRFYVLWRYSYKPGELEAGEAIVFSYSQGVELDGARGLTSANCALVEKKKGKYRLRDYTERGADDRLGLPTDADAPVPLIDSLHRILWLIEHEPRSLTKFLDEARPDRERLRVVAQALAGVGLKGKSEEEARILVTTTPSEQAALGKLLANWKALIEAPAMPLYDRKG